MSHIFSWVKVVYTIMCMCIVCNASIICDVSNRPNHMYSQVYVNYKYF